MSSEYPEEREGVFERVSFTWKGEVMHAEVGREKFGFSYRGAHARTDPKRGRVYFNREKFPISEGTCSCCGLTYEEILKHELGHIVVHRNIHPLSVRVLDSRGPVTALIAVIALVWVALFHQAVPRLTLLVLALAPFLIHGFIFFSALYATEKASWTVSGEIELIPSRKKSHLSHSVNEASDQEG
ncbi:MAG: hypothetical protein ACE5OY_03805 [Candidatus Bathyarchaeia archaeon]